MDSMERWDESPGIRHGNRRSEIQRHASECSEIPAHFYEAGTAAHPVIQCQKWVLELALEEVSARQFHQ